MASPAKPGAAARPVTCSTTKTSRNVSAASMTNAPGPLTAAPQPLAPSEPVWSATWPNVVMPFSSAAATMPPRIWAHQYAPASARVMPRDSSTPRVTAGLMWQPDVGPMA